MKISINVEKSTTISNINICKNVDLSTKDIRNTYVERALKNKRKVKEISDRANK
jgi:dimeric dUTPase (all-alpha-NTP-PPase superfamily)